MGRSTTAFSFSLLASLALRFVLVVQAQQNPGFISIDCGATLPYTEEKTGITYRPDEGLIDSGKIMQTSRMLTYQNNRQVLKNVRIFPNGTRNCYTLRPYQDDIQVCLVNTGKGVPFISALELRALDDGIYQVKSGFLQLHWRHDIGRTLEYDDVRHPDDAYDRIWTPQNYKFGVRINTTSPLNVSGNSDTLKYQVPGKVLNTAQRTMSAGSRFEMKWTPSGTSKKWIVYFHFVEIERLTSGLRRQFTISTIDNNFRESVSLEYLKPVVVVSPPVEGSPITFFIDSTNKSENPPILNAVEFYTIVDLPNVPTAQDDVKAINDIKAIYHIKRESWQGDPCKVIRAHGMV
ncbi:hypothetical protein BT93_D0268 [Corymbia citriodora subsp. variegata]|nr:hypothetical protein BT93_D0268 [Corymbia citriodora subsp. variegata]